MLLPKYRKNRIYDISVEELNSLGVKGVILDVDNTLTVPKTGVLEEGVSEWLDAVQKAGIKLCIASNSKPKRAKIFAQKVNLPLTALCMKPFPSGLLRSCRRMGLKRRECLMVGDQVFTDGLAAKLSGIKMCLVEPFVEEDGKSFRIRRNWEHKLKRKAETK